MNRERAEAHLRRLAEEALRRASAMDRVTEVARVLIAVGALEGAVAGQVLEDFELARAARHAGSLAGGLGPGSRAGSPPARARPAVPGRVVRLGQVIPVCIEDVSGEVYLMSYARRASGPQFSLFARARRLPGPAAPGPVTPPGARPRRSPFLDWPGVSGLERFTATDDRRTGYQMKVRDVGGGPDGWTLIMHPDPPHDPQWLDLTTAPGQPSVRIDLSPSAPMPPGATTAVTAATASPGEHLLHAVAARLLAAPPSDPARTRRLAAGGLGDIITALREAGALPPHSPAPGQLAALCASLHLHGHGITELPARDLPGPWLSMLAHHRAKTRASPARDCCAAAAVVLPELDGIALAILGLHNSEGRTVMHIHASGPMCHVSYQPDELYRWPVTWIRDDSGCWHTTRTRGRSGINGEMALRLEIVPPLSRTTAWIEVHAAGQSAQVLATLPLSWQ